MILFAIAAMALALLALAWIVYPAAMWLRAAGLIPHAPRETLAVVVALAIAASGIWMVAPARFRRSQDQVA
jgi:hypothetical protein